MIKVNIINNYGSLRSFLKLKHVKEISTFVLRELSKNKVEITILLCKNEEIKEYNSKYRQKDYPTDVLSFPYGEKIGRYTYLGDIIISIDKVHEQSKEFEVSEFEEFLRLLVHGILHLLGYDHETSEEDEKIMMELQDNLIAKIMDKYNS
ncbi:MAG: rRNA maturation RNase YbeY [Brevinematales bacterium]|nr:rRNA maturation RNase YbeY [Brevinematales bacterium]